MQPIRFPAIRSQRITISVLLLGLMCAFITPVWPEENPSAAPQVADQPSATQAETIQQDAVQPDAIQSSATQPSETQESASQPNAAQSITEQLSFDSYRLIWDRNIFNPNRRAFRNVVEATRPPDPPPADQLSLSGTMIFEEGSFAFFTGTQSTYQKVAKLGDEIAGFRIAAIETEGVSLERENEKLELPVGKSLIEQEKGKWEIAEGMRVAENRRSDSSSNNRSDRRDNRDNRDNRAEAAPETKAANASAQGSEDILTKLKQRRSQEMKP